MADNIDLNPDSTIPPSSVLIPPSPTSSSIHNELSTILDSSSPPTLSLPSPDLGLDPLLSEPLPISIPPVLMNNTMLPPPPPVLPVPSQPVVLPAQQQPQQPQPASAFSFLHSTSLASVAAAAQAAAIAAAAAVSSFPSLPHFQHQLQPYVSQAAYVPSAPVPPSPAPAPLAATFVIPFAINGSNVVTPMSALLASSPSAMTKSRSSSSHSSHSSSVSSSSSSIMDSSSSAERRKRKDAGQHSRPGKKWTDEEVTRFEQGLEIYGRNWELIAQYIGTGRLARDIGSRAQRHFARLYMQGLPLPAKVRETGEGYTLSGKPLDVSSSKFLQKIQQSLDAASGAAAAAADEVLVLAGVVEGAAGASGDAAVAAGAGVEQQSSNSSVEVLAEKPKKRASRKKEKQQQGEGEEGAGAEVKVEIENKGKRRRSNSAAVVKPEAVGEGGGEKTKRSGKSSRAPSKRKTNKDEDSEEDEDDERSEDNEEDASSSSSSKRRKRISNRNSDDSMFACCTKNDADVDSVQCDKCKDWMHFLCSGWNWTLSQLNKEFYCAKCRALDPSLPPAAEAAASGVALQDFINSSISTPNSVITSGEEGMKILASLLGDVH